MLAPAWTGTTPRGGLAALHGPPALREVAIAELHALLVRGAHHELARRQVTGDERHELATQAADDALVATCEQCFDLVDDTSISRSQGRTRRPGCPACAATSRGARACREDVESLRDLVAHGPVDG